MLQKSESNLQLLKKLMILYVFWKTAVHEISQATETWKIA